MAMRFIAAMIELERGHPSGPDPTITPEDTSRDAGIRDWRQAQYQRRMSSLLAGRGGVTLTTRETGSDAPPGPPVTSKLCPICAAPIRSDDSDVIRCTECRMDYHSPCFWCVLPISEWTAFLTWVYEAPLEALDRRDYICAACRRRQPHLTVAEAIDRQPETWGKTRKGGA